MAADNLEAVGFIRMANCHNWLCEAIGCCHIASRSRNKNGFRPDLYCEQHAEELAKLESENCVSRFNGR